MPNETQNTEGKILRIKKICLKNPEVTELDKQKEINMEASRPVLMQGCFCKDSEVQLNWCEHTQCAAVGVWSLISRKTDRQDGLHRRTTT